MPLNSIPCTVNGREFDRKRAALKEAALTDFSLWGGLVPGNLHEMEELAARGTLCLDEIGEMPLGLQAKLLHVLEDGRFTRIGGSESIGADARVVAVTNRDLEAAMTAGEVPEGVAFEPQFLGIERRPLA